MASTAPNGLSTSHHDRKNDQVLNSSEGYIGNNAADPNEVGPILNVSARGTILILIEKKRKVKEPLAPPVRHCDKNQRDNGQWTMNVMIYRSAIQFHSERTTATTANHRRIELNERNINFNYCTIHTMQLSVTPTRTANETNNNSKIEKTNRLTPAAFANTVNVNQRAWITLHVYQAGVEDTFYNAVESMLIRGDIASIASTSAGIVQSMNPHPVLKHLLRFEDGSLERLLRKILICLQEGGGSKDGSMQEQIVQGRTNKNPTRSVSWIEEHPPTRSVSWNEDLIARECDVM